MIAVGLVVVRSDSVVVAVARAQEGIGFQATIPVSFKTSFWSLDQTRSVFCFIPNPGRAAASA